MKKTTNRIWVTFQKEGIHCYPAAATDPKLATGDWDDVSFLGVPHRHIFYFKVSIDVFTDDRDIEFIQFKRWLERLYSGDTLKLDYKSCEMISDELYQQITKKYPGRKISIEVSEDMENGSYAEYDADPATIVQDVVHVGVAKNSDGSEKKVYYVDLQDIDPVTINDYIRNIKNQTVEQSVTPVPESVSVQDDHLNHTFESAMKKMDDIEVSQEEINRLKQPDEKSSFASSVSSLIRNIIKSK